jgi:hypothetical protein
MIPPKKPDEIRKRARQLYIDSLGQKSYEDIALQLRLEGLGDVELPTLRKWRSRDIKAGSVKPDVLAREFERIGKQVERVAKALDLPSNLTVAEKIECAKVADIEDSHERMLRVVNAAADKLAREIPDMDITTIEKATTLSYIAERIAESSIKLRLALVQVRDLQMKLIGAQDENGKTIPAEIMPPNKPAGLAGAVTAFRSAG